MISSDIKQYLVIKQLLIEIDLQRYIDQIIEHKCHSTWLHETQIDTIETVLNQMEIPQKDVAAITQCFVNHRKDMEEYFTLETKINTI